MPPKRRPEELDSKGFNRLQAKELKQLCGELGIPQWGAKPVLIERVNAFYQASREKRQAESSSASSKPTGSASSTQPPGTAADTGLKQQAPVAAPKEAAKAKAKPKAKPKAKGKGMNSKQAAALFRQSFVDQPPMPTVTLSAPAPGTVRARNPMMCSACRIPYDIGHQKYSHDPATFVCPICRFKVMDPFKQVLIPNGLLYQATMLDSEHTFQVELPFLMSWQDRGFQLEFRMLQIDCPKVKQVWPKTLSVTSNGCLLFSIVAPEEGHKRRDVPQEVTNELHSGYNTITLQAADERVTSYTFALVVCQPATIPILASAVPRVEEDEGEIRVQELLRRPSGEAEGEDLVCLSSNMLRLRCPITMDRVQDPVRGANCKHLQCFGLQAYLQSNKQMDAFNQRWVCPLCSLVVRPADLVRDVYVAEVLRHTPRDAEEVEVRRSGSWRLRKKERKTSPESSAKVEERPDEDDELLLCGASCKSEPVVAVPTVEQTPAASSAVQAPDAVLLDTPPAALLLDSPAAAVPHDAAPAAEVLPKTESEAKRPSAEPSQMATPQKRLRLLYALPSWLTSASEARSPPAPPAPPEVAQETLAAPDTADKQNGRVVEIDLCD